MAKTKADARSGPAKGPNDAGLEFVTTGDAARALQVSLRTVQRWCEGEVPLLTAYRLPSGLFKVRREQLNIILRAMVPPRRLETDNTVTILTEGENAIPNHKS